MEQIEQQIKEIQDRNRRVEWDKAWEVSKTRKIIIALLTYVVIVLFFFAADLPKPFINAIVPTVGFILLTLSLSLFKRLWLGYQSK